MATDDVPLGLPRKTVILREYDLRWADEFDAEARALATALGDQVEGIEHVGSTAVPDLIAKPVLDIAVAIKDGVTFGEVRDRLEAAGYEYRGDLGDEGGLVFAKGPETGRTHYLHVVSAASDQWANYIVFRDALRRDHDLRDRYAELKRGLASRFPLDRESYIGGKHTFIRGVIASYRDARATTDTD